MVFWGLLSPGFVVFQSLASLAGDGVGELLLFFFHACGKKGDPLPDSKHYMKTISKVILCRHDGVIQQ